MMWIVISVIITLILFFVLGMDTNTEWELRGRQIFSLFGLLFLIFGFFTYIPVNTVGIVFSPLNGTSNITLSEGIQNKNILDKVYKISTEVQSVSVEGLTTQTKDAQYVTSNLDIKYSVNKENAYLVFTQYKNLKNVSERAIMPAVQKVLEKITTQYNVIDVLGEKRNEIYDKLDIDLNIEFAKSGIKLEGISIIDMDAGDKIEEAITNEAVAKKAVETAEQELLKAQTEAKKKSVTAQAEQDAAKIEAETKIIKAEAERKANELLKISLSDELLQQQWIEKWNGVVPTYYGGENDGLMFNIENSKTETKTENN